MVKYKESSLEIAPAGNEGGYNIRRQKRIGVGLDGRQYDPGTGICTAYLFRLGGLLTQPKCLFHRSPWNARRGYL